jgi:hypothetical protein
MVTTAAARSGSSETSWRPHARILSALRQYPLLRQLNALRQRDREAQRVRLRRDSSADVLRAPDDDPLIDRVQKLGAALLDATPWARSGQRQGREPPSKARPGHRDLDCDRDHALAPRWLPGHVAARRQGARGGCRHPAAVFPIFGAEVYDPESGTWTATGKMITGPFNAQATLLPDGRVLVTGPEQLYDPDSGTWAATGKMIAPRYNHVAILLWCTCACTPDSPPARAAPMMRSRSRRTWPSETYVNSIESGVPMTFMSAPVSGHPAWVVRTWGAPSTEAVARTSPSGSRSARPCQAPESANRPHPLSAGPRTARSPYRWHRC